LLVVTLQAFCMAQLTCQAFFINIKSASSTRFFCLGIIDTKEEIEPDFTPYMVLC
jgi:hypothetical protein